VLLITGAEAEGFTVITNVAEPVPALFVADMVTLDVPAPVGVPVIAPDVELRINPAGKVAAPKEVGLPEAVIW
jgi:hypothetical protein